VIVQIHTDPNIESTQRLTEGVEASVTSAVGRFEDRVTRVQVHLEDTNSSQKQGSGDKRCMMEARLNGRAPVAVTHFAPTVEQAVNGAADKLERTVGRVFDRMEDV